MNKDGEELQLSTLCNDDEPNPYSNSADASAIDEALGQNTLTDEIRRAFQIENEDGEVEDGDEDTYAEEEVYEAEDYGDDYGNGENN